MTNLNFKNISTKFVLPLLLSSAATGQDHPLDTARATQKRAVLATKIIDVATLTADQGLAIHGAATNDRIGRSVSAVPNTGVLIGALFMNSNAGSFYFIHKNHGQNPVELGALAPTIGFQISGTEPNQQFGGGVYFLDGILNNGKPTVGIYSKNATTSEFFNSLYSLPIDQLNPTPYLTFTGSMNSAIGFPMKGLRDINSDGVSDLAIGSLASDLRGSLYLLLKNADGTFTAPAHMDNWDTSSPKGIRLDGATQDRNFGRSVENGANGYLLIGSSHAGIGGTGSRINTGSAYLVHMPSLLTQLNGATSFNMNNFHAGLGLRLDGPESNQLLGESVVNLGTGFDKNFIAITSRSKVYVTTIEDLLAAANGAATFNMANFNEAMGYTISHSGNIGIVINGGDLNKDGLDELVIGGPNSAYVLKGKKSGYTGNVDLETITPDQGFKLQGIHNSAFGASLSKGGDLNDDEFGDLVVGAYGASPSADRYGAGITYIINGFNEKPTLSTHALPIEGGSTSLYNVTSSNLWITDVDTADEDLIFNIANLLNGLFLKNNQTVATFTQADINAGSIQFLSTSNCTAPTYLVSVSDIASTTWPVCANVTFTPAVNCTAAETVLVSPCNAPVEPTPVATPPVPTPSVATPSVVTPTVATPTPVAVTPTPTPVVDSSSTSSSSTSESTSSSTSVLTSSSTSSSTSDLTSSTRSTTMSSTLATPNDVPVPTSGASSIHSSWLSPKAWINAVQDWWSPSADKALKSLQLECVKVLESGQNDAFANDAFTIATKIMVSNVLKDVRGALNTPDAITQKTVDALTDRLNAVKFDFVKTSAPTVIASHTDGGGVNANLNSTAGSIGSTASLLSLGQ